MLDRLRAGLAHLRSQGFKKIEKRRRSALGRNEIKFGHILNWRRSLRIRWV